MFVHHDAGVIRIKPWLVPSVSTMLPRWLLGLLDETTASPLWKAAALVGSEMGVDVMVGQVSYVQHEAGIVSMKIMGPRAARALDKFGNECCMTVRASILRTAIMVGLGLPKVSEGVMSQTRSEPFTRQEVLGILDAGKRKFPEEF